jgi:hypothetical protein
MNEKYLFIEVSALPESKNNMFLDTRNWAACRAVSEELMWKIEKANSNYVMIFTHDWIKKHYKKTIKKALERHHRLIQSGNQIDNSRSLLGEGVQTSRRACKLLKLIKILIFLPFKFLFWRSIRQFKRSPNWNHSAKIS